MTTHLAALFHFIKVLLSPKHGRDLCTTAQGGNLFALLLPSACYAVRLLEACRPLGQAVTTVMIFLSSCGCLSGSVLVPAFQPEVCLGRQGGLLYHGYQLSTSLSTASLG